MNKRKIAPGVRCETAEPGWLALDAIAEVEISSESAEHPVEAALAPGSGAGWRADSSGPQTIRLKFDPPRPLRQVRIVVDERERARTQEFVLRAASQPSGPWREIARQHFNFSPSGATRQEENYRLDSGTIAALELTITPDISGGEARASIQEFRVAG
jgi:hypothetical protein